MHVLCNAVAGSGLLHVLCNAVAGSGLLHVLCNAVAGSGLRYCSTGLTKLACCPFTCSPGH